jgi:hypothetical protein
MMATISAILAALTLLVITSGTTTVMILVTSAETFVRLLTTTPQFVTILVTIVALPVTLQSTMIPLTAASSTASVITVHFPLASNSTFPRLQSTTPLLP